MLPASLRMALVGLMLGSFCVSCADLTEVAKFASSAKSASTGYADIVNDFAGSAARRVDYLRDKKMPGGQPDPKTQAQADVQKYKDLRPAMLAAQKPLVDYIAALAAISTDSVDKGAKDDSSGKADDSGTDASEKPSQSSMEKAHMTSTQATAALGLATKVVAALTAGYRSDKTGKAIHDCNPELQDYLEGLEQIVGTDYPLLLDAEKISVEGYYSDLLAKYGDKEPLAAITTGIEEQEDLAAIEKRRKAATAYMRILTDIGKGHQKLYDAGEKLNLKQLVSAVEPYAADIEKQSVTVAKAF